MGHRKRAGSILTYAFLILSAVIMIFPFYWMLITAMKTFAEATAFPPAMIPGSAAFENVITVLTGTPILRYILNSFLVTAAQLAACLLTTILGAFALARLNIKGKNVILATMMALTMAPFELIVLTNYATTIKLNLNDSLFALILPFIGNVYYTIILRNSFLSTPGSLYYSAKIDGAKDREYLWRILIPLSKPTLTSIAVFNVIASWNSFMWPFLVINSPEKRTWPFGLFAFATEQWTNIPLTMAASCIALIPVLLFFLFARKHLITSVFTTDTPR